MKKGKFIVIDGTDGSGKATQTALLAKRLRNFGWKIKVEDFPQYGKKSAGLVEEYLNGKYGSAKELGPYIPSIFYAADRFAASKRIIANLKKGYIVISNRYVTANAGHQGGKIVNKKAREKYLKWLFDLEYIFFGIPKPNLTLILHLPAKIAQSLVGKKALRAYIGRKKRDMHEKDLRHLQDAERTYLEIAKSFKYPIVKCFPRKKILSRNEVSEKIWSLVKKIL